MAGDDKVAKFLVPAFKADAFVEEELFSTFCQKIEEGMRWEV